MSLILITSQLKNKYPEINIDPNQKFIIPHQDINQNIDNSADLSAHCDLTLPIDIIPNGRAHILHQTANEISDIFHL